MRKPRKWELVMLACAAAAALAILLAPEPGPGVAPERGGAVAAPEWAGEDGLMDINAASAETLELLPGVGPVRAAAITEYREEYGPFESVYELLAVPGLSWGIIDEFIDYICVEDTNEDTGS